MGYQLHITNGDSLTNRLSLLNVQGDIITWREMLCEGKTESTVGSERFWKTRFDFLHNTYQVSKHTFIEKTLKEYRSLCQHKKQNQIVLWFEYDLFCQINMLAVLSWLKTHRKHAEISLVCSGHIEGKKKMFALNELTDAQLQEHYVNRIVLTRDDIEYADYVWQLYCSDNPIRLQNLTDFDSFQFNYLGPAIQSHLQRFPEVSSGLNVLETHVLQIIKNNKLQTKKEVLQTLLTQKNNYGFGDVQYVKIIESLTPLFASLSPIRLTNSAKSLLKGEVNYYQNIRNNDSYLGGALKYNYLYHTETSRILKL